MPRRQVESIRRSDGTFRNRPDPRSSPLSLSLAAHVVQNPPTFLSIAPAAVWEDPIPVEDMRLPIAVVSTETMLLHRIEHGSQTSKTPTCGIFVSASRRTLSSGGCYVCVCCTQVLCVNRDLSRELCYSSVKEDHKVSVLPTQPTSHIRSSQVWRDGF